MKPQTKVCKGLKINSETRPNTCLSTLPFLDSLEAAVCGVVLIRLCYAICNKLFLISSNVFCVCDDSIWFYFLINKGT